MNRVDKYKVLINIDGSNYLPVKLTKPITVSGSLDSKSYRYSRKSSTWKLVKSENKTVYNALLPYIQSPSTLLLNEILVKIELWDDWVTLTETIFTGYLPLSGISINEDTGVIELTPTERSVYDWYDHHKGDKRDIFNEVLQKEHGQLQYFVQTETEAYWTPAFYELEGEWLTYETPAGFDSEFYSVPTYNIANSYEPLYKQNSWAIEGLNLYHCLVANDASNQHFPHELGIYWELIPYAHGGPLNRIMHSFRQISDMPFFTVEGGGPSGALFTHGNGVYQPGFPVVKIADDGTATNLDPIRWSSPLPDPLSGNMKLGGEWGSFDPIANSYYVGFGVIQPLDSVLKSLWKIDYQEIDYLTEGSGLTLNSLFLTEATNPVTGIANKLTNLHLALNSVIKGTADSSTKGEMTLDQLMSDLCETFNLSWAIIGTNLYIEHLNFFINGFSYSSTPGIYADLTIYPAKYQVTSDLDGSISDQEYKYNVSTPEKEVFHFPGGFDYDGQIKYDSQFAVKGDELKHDINIFMTDLHSVLANSDTADDLWCLIACEPVADNVAQIYRRTAGLRWLQGPQTFYTIVYNNPFLPFKNLKNTAIEYTNPAVDFPNGDLQWNNLLNDFWIYQRIFKTGQINGKIPSVTFETQQKIRKQRDVKFPRLSGAFDPYELITTNLGNGTVETFEIITDSDFMKVQLNYDEKP